MPEHTVQAEAIDWRRVGALSTTTSLHLLAAAAALWLVTAPNLRTTPNTKPEPPTMAIDLVEAQPMQVPELPTADPVATLPVEIPATAKRPTRPVASLRPALASAPPDLVPVVGIQEGRLPVIGRGGQVELLSARPPRYPMVAVQQEVEGEALVRIRVGTDGRASEVSLARSSGHRDLDRAALDAARDWRFRPALRNGSPVPAWVEVPIAFRLDRR